MTLLVSLKYGPLRVDTGEDLPPQAKGGDANKRNESRAAGGEKAP